MFRQNQRQVIEIAVIAMVLTLLWPLSIPGSSSQPKGKLDKLFHNMLVHQPTQPQNKDSKKPSTESMEFEKMKQGNQNTVSIISLEPRVSYVTH